MGSWHAPRTVLRAVTALERASSGEDGLLGLYYAVWRWILFIGMHENPFQGADVYLRRRHVPGMGNLRGL